jgi:secondary thiamine-phosphate synthase enzyme
MQQFQRTLEVATRGKGLYDFTAQLAAHVAESGIRTGLVHVFIRHTSASLLIQENADPEVHRDLERFFARLVPDGEPLFKHVDEGPDDMPAHVRAALTQSTLTIPVADGRPLLGTWQGVYVYEHRNRPYTRSLVLHTAGE